MGGTIREVKKEMCYFILLHTVGIMLCVVISISMCYNPNLYYLLYFQFLCNLFFQIHYPHNKF
jgi:hypothetical protein